jgi:hypothetical protein
MKAKNLNLRADPPVRASKNLEGTAQNDPGVVSPGLGRT